MKLTLPQISLELKKLKGWSLSGGKISRLFQFDNFPSAVIFINRIVDPVCEMDHYPQITINYNRVTVTLYDHTAGGLTDRDFAVAVKIDELACSKEVKKNGN